MALKLEFVNDVPSRVGAVSHHPTLGRLDSAENILAKDVADIWGFCCLRGMPIGPALTSASSKEAGLFPPDLSHGAC
ncbi:MAG: hypothetical protein AB1806_05525 [Acidobacteriota bacterium]